MLLRTPLDDLIKVKSRLQVKKLLNDSLSDPVRTIARTLSVGEYNHRRVCLRKHVDAVEISGDLPSMVEGEPGVRIFADYMIGLWSIYR
jgi:hypothetical protein